MNAYFDHYWQWYFFFFMQRRSSPQESTMTAYFSANFWSLSSY
ncbi:hypothetical protein [Enterococcus casseliflavus]|nr:hypothetical protein [Enterococcus casseliflavus]